MDWFTDILDKGGDLLGKYGDAYISDKFGMGTANDAVSEGSPTTGGQTTQTGIPVNASPQTNVAAPAPNMVLGLDLNNVNWGMVGAVTAVLSFGYIIARGR